MSEQKMVIMDGNEAAASVAYRLSEVVAIYPITPSSPMAEWADQWRSEGKKKYLGRVAHCGGAAERGWRGRSRCTERCRPVLLPTTFTASQGLLLMIPNMYKIAGELTPATMHVTARTLATHALSIFGDHSDVMACRSTGWAMLSSNSVQEVADMALVAQIATLESRIPFIHFFDGFRTSHEVGKILPISDETIRALLDDKYIIQFRQNALSPDRPIIRGTAQNPDVFFQAREACNPFHDAVPGIVQSVMDRFAALTGRAYHLFDYVGAADAERVIVMMGSGAEAAEEAVDAVKRQGEEDWHGQGPALRPFDADALLGRFAHHGEVDRRTRPHQGTRRSRRTALSGRVTVLAENAATLRFAAMPPVIGGRYGLSSKEFTPAMVKGIFDEIDQDRAKESLHHRYRRRRVAHQPDLRSDLLDRRSEDRTRRCFMVWARTAPSAPTRTRSRSSASETPNFAQGYFVYDSKKSGSMTTSHLRFGPSPIRSTYLITRASFVACHNFSFLEKMNVLEAAMPGAVFLLNSPFSAAEVWDNFPRRRRKRCCARRSSSTSSMATRWRARPVWERASTPSCRPASSRSAVCCRARKRLRRSRRRSRKPTASAAKRWCRRTSPPSMHALAHLEKVELPSRCIVGTSI